MLEVEKKAKLKKSQKSTLNLPHNTTLLNCTVAHDVSARDWQMKRNGGQWLVGKVRSLLMLSIN